METVKDIEKEVDATIAVDFDGPIHRFSKGVYDKTIYDEPTDNAKGSLEMLSKQYKIVVFSCRADPNRPLIDGESGANRIWGWLNKYDLAKYIDEVTHVKPRAKYYIDDRGVTFVDWRDTLTQIGE